MIFDTHEGRGQLVDVMKEIVSGALPVFREKLDQLLLPGEKAIQDYVDDLGFKEGAWYRPPHNLLVPTAMIAISRVDGAPRDLVYVAQVHDAGNSQMKVAPTVEGADWEKPSKRWGHMGIGAAMLADRLSLLQDEGIIDVSELRKMQLYAIVATHDGPYLGVPLDTPGLFHESLARDALAFRDSDRAYVMSASSFHKDAIAQMSDASYAAKAEALGLDKVTPENVLRGRLSFFFSNPSELPSGWDNTKYGMIPNGELYNEGGRVEPMRTSAGKSILEHQLLRRADEVAQIAEMTSVQQFGDMFERAYVDEMVCLLDYAAGRFGALEYEAQAA